MLQQYFPVKPIYLKKHRSFKESNFLNFLEAYEIARKCDFPLTSLIEALKSHTSLHTELPSTKNTELV